MDFQYNKNNPNLRHFYLDALKDKKEDNEKAVKLWMSICTFFFIVAFAALVVLVVMLVMIGMKDAYTLTSNNKLAITHLSIWFGIFTLLGVGQLLIALYYVKDNKRITQTINEYNREIRQNRNSSENTTQ